jgi:DNA processing protein
VDDTQTLLTLVMAGVSPRAVKALRARAPLGDVLGSPEGHADLLTARALSALRSGEAGRRARDERERASRSGIAIVGLTDSAYPERLRCAYDPPPVLHLRGRLHPGECVAVVGSRNASSAGLALARALGRDLAAAGVSVVSGLARGIDGEAHRGALEAKGHTVAVLGSALDCIYPREHAALAAAIAERGGAVVSEFTLGTGPRREHFPRRNRVIAGLCRAVVVVEATEKSGALVTARHALDDGRDVMAVPGHPSEPRAAGTNALIRDGAELVRGAQDVLAALGLEAAPPRGDEATGDDVLDRLRQDRAMSLDDLVAESGRSVPELLSHLTLLEMSDKVRRLPGPAFVRS